MRNLLIFTTSALANFLVVPVTASDTYQPSREELCRFKSQAAEIMMRQRLNGADKQELLSHISPNASDEEQGRQQRLVEELYEYELTGDNDAQRFSSLTRTRCLEE